jgi:hypothetical protein
MFTGRDALFSIEQAIGSARADESRLDAALRSAIDEAARLRQEEAEGFRALARVKLDTMVRDRVLDDLDATERRALALLENQRREIEDIARRRDAAQAELDKAEATKHERDQILADALEELDERRQRVAELVKSDAAWKAAQAAVAAAQAVAENADKKASLAEDDLAAKRQPYENDPIFMYLWNKKHGRAEDRSGTFVKFFDRRVARLVGYQGARANFAMLQEIPARLREHAKNKQADVEAARNAVTAVERRALVADGIEPAEARVAAAQQAAKAVGETVLKITAGLDRIEDERKKTMQADEDAAYGRAVDMLAEAMEREDLRQLHHEAVRTATKEDDRIVTAISNARTALQKTDGEVAQIRVEIREMASRRSELEGARNRARNVGYDDPRGTFGGNGQEAIGEVIGAILRGAMRGGALDSIFRDQYRAPQRRADVDGFPGAPSWPTPWGTGPADTWGDAWGRGSSGSSGDDGGGWRTGGSF